MHKTFNGSRQEAQSFSRYSTKIHVNKVAALKPHSRLLPFFLSLQINSRCETKRNSMLFICME